MRHRNVCAILSHFVKPHYRGIASGCSLYYMYKRASPHLRVGTGAPRFFNDKYSTGNSSKGEREKEIVTVQRTYMSSILDKKGNARRCSGHSPSAAADVGHVDLHCNACSLPSASDVEARPLV